MTQLILRRLIGIYNKVYTRLKRGEYRTRKMPKNMTQLTQKQLSKIYNEIFSKLCNEQYESMDIKKTDQPPKKRKLNEEEAHEAAIDFLLYYFCDKNRLAYHKNYYQTIYVPWGASEIKLDNIEFEDLIEFISPETKITN